MRYKKLLAAAAASTLLLSGCDTAPTADKPADTTVSDMQTETYDHNDEQVLFEYISSGDGLELTRYINDEIVVPETINGEIVKTFRGSAFSNTNIKKLTVKANIKSMPVMCECPLLTEIDLPSSVTDISPRSFDLCRSLKAVNIESGGELCSVDGSVYTADMKTLVFVPYAAGKEITIPEGVEVIGKRAMQYCEAVRVNLPSTLKEIGTYAFDSSALEGAEIPEGVKKIGEHAFDNTHFREITLPDSLTECGPDAFSYCNISAPAALADTEWLSNNSRVSFRDISMLENAVRQGLAEYGNNIVFKDLTFDGFPELIAFGRKNTMDVYFYNTEACQWENSFYYNIDYTKPLDDWLTGEMDKLVSSGSSYDAVPTEKFMGKIEYYRVNETGILLNRVGRQFYFEDCEGIARDSNLHPEDCTLLGEFNEENAKELYSPIGPYAAFDGPFTDEPNGKPVASFKVNEITVTDMPYTLNLIPENKKVYIGGVDILHDGSTDGVSFDYYDQTLILDNAVIETTDKNAISFEGFSDPTIKLIGENRVMSENKYSINADNTLTITGDGSLEVGRMCFSLPRKHEGFQDNLFMKENVVLKETYSGAFAESRHLSGIVIKDTCALICGSESALSRGLILDKLTISDNAVCAVYSSENGIYSHDTFGSSVRLNIFGNGRLDITCAEDGISHDDTGGGEIGIYDNAEVNINAGGYGVIAYYGLHYPSANGYVTLEGDPKLTIHSERTCICAEDIIVSGGTLDLNSGTISVTTDITVNGEIEYKEGEWYQWWFDENDKYRSSEASEYLKLKVKQY